MKENSICGDNRFEIIEKAKEMLLNATNIEDSKEEMKVLTNILFRMWQVGLMNEEKLEINKLQKENSIEEDIKIVENYLANSAINEIESNFFKNGGWETIDLEIPKSMQHILSDYKRVLKENETLSRENRKLKEENEYNKLLLDMNNNFKIDKKIEIYKWNVIEIQKIKDTIRHYQELQDNYIKKYDEINEGLQAMINVLQELLESEE